MDYPETAIGYFGEHHVNSFSTIYKDTKNLTLRTSTHRSGYAGDWMSDIKYPRMLVSLTFEDFDFKNIEMRNVSLPPLINVLKFKNVNLQDIPDHLPRFLTELIISNCSNMYPPTNELKDLIYLKKLTFYGCGETAEQSMHSELDFESGVLPDSLEELNCSFSNLLTIPSRLPPNLRRLYCEGNYLTYLPELPQTLEYLHCSENNSLELPDKLPESLNDLECCWILMENGPPKFPERLKLLSCRSNEIVRFDKDALPRGLEYLDIGGNELTELPDLPDGLLDLHADTNAITKLPLVLPRKLQNLSVGYNGITSLPSLPPCLLELDCDTCENLEELPEELPEKLQKLNIEATKIKRIPRLPETIRVLKCRSDKLEEITNVPYLIPYKGTNLRLPEGVLESDCVKAYKRFHPLIRQMQKFRKKMRWLILVRCVVRYERQRQKMKRQLHPSHISGLVRTHGVAFDDQVHINEPVYWKAINNKRRKLEIELELENE